MSESDSAELPEVRKVSLWGERKSVFEADGHEIILWMSAWSGREIVELDGQRVSDLRSLSGGTHEFEHGGHAWRVEVTTESVTEGIQRVELYRDGERVGIDRMQIDEGQSGSPQPEETSASRDPDHRDSKPAPRSPDPEPRPGPSVTRAGHLLPPAAPRDLTPESVGVRPGRPGDAPPGGGGNSGAWIPLILVAGLLLVLLWLRGS